MYDTASLEVQALLRDRDNDRAKLENCESSLVKARADAASARTETWSMADKERFGISQVEALKDDHARTVHAGSLSLTEAQTKLELSQQEVTRICLIGENLQRQHQLQVAEVARLNEKVADRAPGYQKLKLSMENIIQEQKVAFDKQVRVAGLETKRLNEQIYLLEDMCNQQSAQAVAVRVGSEDAYLESVGASAGLATTLATRPSRPSGGNPAGGSGGNPGGSGSGGGGGGGPGICSMTCGGIPVAAAARRTLASFSCTSV